MTTVRLSTAGVSSPSIAIFSPFRDARSTSRSILGLTSTSTGPLRPFSSARYLPVNFGVSLSLNLPFLPVFTFSTRSSACLPASE